jgi:cell division inhibitor SepF
VSFLRNALIYLGFVEDDLQGEIASYGDHPGRRNASQQFETERLDPNVRAYDERWEAGRPYEEPRGYEQTRAYDYEEQQPVRQAPPRQQDASQLASVHQFPPRSMSEVHIVRPESYGDAQQIGDRMRRGLPVIVNLEEAESELARRIVAFASGLVYGLDGNLQKLSRRIYLITPAEMEVSSEDKRRLAEDSGLGF